MFLNNPVYVVLHAVCTCVTNLIDNKDPQLSAISACDPQTTFSFLKCLRVDDIQPSAMTQPTVRAFYKAPNGEHDFEHVVAAPIATDVESKKKYLSELRSSSKQLQEAVNAFLTAKMEEDKINTAKHHSLEAGTASKDEEEEAHYGEEKAEED